MGCSCIAVDADECYETLSRGTPVARKEHTCGECGREIVPGENYERYEGIFDGHIDTHKTCLDCVSVRDAFFCSWIYGNIWEDLREQLTWGGLSWSSIPECTEAAKEKIFAMIEEYWAELYDEVAP